MDRKEFFKKTCLYGLCGCAGMVMFSNTDLIAASGKSEENEPDWRIAFMQKRFAKLVGFFNSKLDEKTKNELLEQMGRECAKERKDEIMKFQGNIKDFLKDIENKWVEKAEYIEDKNEIRINDKKRDQCFCPFVDGKLMTKDFCNCSIGWQKETYETITGKKVDVRVVSSILHGDDHCSFTISILPS